MKPYLAVLFDSFLESMKSKVLWVLLAAWTLILLALFPLSISKGESYLFSNGNFKSAKIILDQLAAASNGKGTRKHKAIYAKLDEDFQGILKQRQTNQRRVSIGKLIESFNRLLKEKDLYDAAIWPTAVKRPELKELIENPNRSDLELEKLNRGLIDLAFEGSISSSSGQATWITYAGLRLGNGLPISQSQLRTIIETVIFPLVMRLGLGIGAMLVAIIITSPMIPDMFQTGSMHLLLSKPISRSLLFLTKFVGGCTFVALNIVYLLVGLFLYAGIRLEIWNAGILWCIPLFIFTFMIFYSVSALSGLIWKNPIISVVVTAMFWATCFTVGLIHFFFNDFVNSQGQTQRIFSIKDKPILSTQQGRIQFWNEEDRQWKTAFGEVDGQKVLGPVWLSNEKSMYFARPPRLPFGISIGQDTRLELGHLPDFADASDTTFQSKPWDDGRLDSGPELPSDPQQLFAWKDTFGVLNAEGIYRFDAEASVKAEQQKSMLGGLGFGLTKNLIPAYPAMTKKFEYKKPLDIGVAPSFARVVLYSNGNVIDLKATEDGLEESGKLSLDIPSETVAILGANDKTAVVCPIGMAPFVIDLDTMKIQGRIETIGDDTINQVRVDANGRFVLLATNGTVWTVDAIGKSCEKPSIAGQGSALAIHFNESNQLWVAHARGKVDLVDLNSGSSITSIRPKAFTSQIIFDYLVNPFYQVNPKPSAMNDTIEYVLKNSKNKTIAIDRGDLDLPKIASDPWTPIWTNLLFIGFMLSVSCWYLYRQDL